MEFIVVCSVALFASGLTLFSGFGLGTLLLPAFLLFFPADVAVALTAIVHLLNNVFKLVLLGKNADKQVVLRFGIPALLASFIGAMLLVFATGLAPLGTVQIFNASFHIMPVKLLLAVLMIIFAIVEIMPAVERIQLERKYLFLGGALSGFFGGLSGHQGALRSMFLVRAGLSKEAFIGTGVVIACLIDVTRLSVYAQHITASGLEQNAFLLVAATLSAFAGAYGGNKLVKKVTLGTIQKIVSIMLIAIALALALGVI